MSTTTIAPEILKQMAKSASSAYENAYCPYSKYPVGAAILTNDGAIVNGCNVENAVYVVIHAEENAIGNAITKGHRVFQAVLVLSKDGEASPCGICRQKLYEHAKEMPVFTTNPNGEIIHQWLLSELLPHAFGPHNLKESPNESP